jgi:hypothetical protein
LGGFAGISDKYFAVPRQALQLDQEQEASGAGSSRERFEGRTGFDENNWPDFSKQQVVIYEFYDVPQPTEERTLDPPVTRDGGGSGPSSLSNPNQSCRHNRTMLNLDFPSTRGDN